MARGLCSAGVLLGLSVLTAAGQTPQPFPRPGGTSTTATAPTSQAPAAPRSATAAPPPASPTALPVTPTPDSLGVAVYPTAQFIASYDAGRGQRYYLFGTSSAYADVIAYYRTQLKEKGDQVFEQPPTQMFQVGRFREETMAFPPGVTVKDWTWGGSQGYPNPKLGAEPARYPTIVMIVPAPPAGAPTR